MGHLDKLDEELKDKGLSVVAITRQDRSAVDVDFFGRPASTTSAIASLALHTGAAIVPVFALPLPGNRYRLIYEAPIVPPDAGDPDAVRICTQRCTDLLERYVRRDPHLWLWMHRRWRAPAPAARSRSATVPGQESAP